MSPERQRRVQVTSQNTKVAVESITTARSDESTGKKSCSAVLTAVMPQDAIWQTQPCVMGVETWFSTTTVQQQDALRKVALTDHKTVYAHPKSPVLSAVMLDRGECNGNQITLHKPFDGGGIYIVLIAVASGEFEWQSKAIYFIRPIFWVYSGEVVRGHCCPHCGGYTMLAP